MLTCDGVRVGSIALSPLSYLVTTALPTELFSRVTKQLSGYCCITNIRRRAVRCDGIVNAMVSCRGM